MVDLFASGEDAGPGDKGPDIKGLDDKGRGDKGRADRGLAVPLAERLRPAALSEVVGQEHLTGPEGAIGRMVAVGRLSSIILWGPPGTGKTTIARLLADCVGMRFAAALQSPCAPPAARNAALMAS